MGSNTKNSPNQATIDYMMKLYRAAEPYSPDDPAIHLVDSTDEEHDKRMDATAAKKWLTDVGVLKENG